MDALTIDQSYERSVPAHAGPLRYRPELDGLRALAVAAVIATHLRLPGFPGGFLGVDIFFVLSGYLIFADVAARGGPRAKSALSFYGRRLRRIVPAYYAMLTLSLAAGFIVLMPGDLTSLATGAIASALFVPNILFWTQSGYFDPPAAFNPLLHSWSLGIEAQFYLLFPLLPWVLSRAAPRAVDDDAPQAQDQSAMRRRHVMLAALAVAAFALCMGLREIGHSAGFYLIPGRLWEFLAGCVAASGAIPPLRHRVLREFVAAGGLLVLLLAMTIFSGKTPHPAPITLIPVLATAGIIHATDRADSAAGWLLRRKAFVFTGVISYSLYLWHWPLIVFARYAGVPFTPVTIGAGLVALYLASAASWAFIETPPRRMRRRPGTSGALDRHRAAALWAAGGMAILTASCLILGLRGLPQRFPAEVAQVAEYYDFGERGPYREGTCFLTTRQSIGDFKPAQCLQLDPGAKNVLVLGDSHAAHLWEGLHGAWPGVNFLQATASGCKPSLAPTGADRCTILMHQMVREFLPQHHVDAILIAALWDADDIGPLRDLIKAVKPYARGGVDLIGPMPRYDEPMATLLAQSLWKNDLASVASHRLASVPVLDQEMAAAFTGTVHYVSAYQAMCPRGDCLLFAAPGIPMQFDYHHLTDRGGDRLIAIFKTTNALNF